MNMQITAEQKIESLAHAINNLCLALDGVENAVTDIQKEVANSGLAETRKEAIDLLDQFGLLTDTPVAG